MADDTTVESDRSIVKDRGAMMMPGAGTPERRIHEMIRVDHAGEYGATRIYAGQLAVLGRSRATARSAELVRHMAEQEDAHLEGFNKVMVDRGVRPTALIPVWHVAGFALGAATALMGERAAMACTEAVEEVIVEHYAAQERELAEREPALKSMIAQFKEEEAEHQHTAIDEGSQTTPGHPVLSNAIKLGCRLAIRLSEKI